jgi:His-Xaa-Ser system radical SAM maturase HxsC
MCSQPPTAADDSWLVEEAIDAIRHLRVSPRVLGLTGGEPLLLGAGLRRVLDSVSRYHPETQVEVLTNGRLFADARLVTEILNDLSLRVRWLVPLYGHADFVHDFVVQARGAFDETLAGLLALQAHRQEIQLRVVLIEPVLKVLPELAGFLGRNLPFVREVAFMGCEPIGFALANRDFCEVDLTEWATDLEKASRILQRHAIPHLFMNAPLCALPRSLWPVAHRSISDWKNVYASECESCAVKAECSGLFAWHEKGWKPAPLRTMQKGEVMA